MRQAAHCWHVPGRLAGGWRLWEGKMCSEAAAICPPVTWGWGAVSQEAV